MKPDPEHRFALIHELWRQHTGQLQPCTRWHIHEWARLAIQVDNHPDMTMELEKAVALERIKLAEQLKQWKQENQ